MAPLAVVDSTYYEGLVPTLIVTHPSNEIALINCSSIPGGSQGLPGITIRTSPLPEVLLQTITLDYYKTSIA